MMFLDRPLCKKCIPEYIAARNENNEGEGNPNSQAKILGINTMALNAYQTEKSQISRSLERLQYFRKDFRAMQSEIDERKIQSDAYLKELPPLMESMFDRLEELVQ